MKRFAAAAVLLTTATAAAAPPPITALTGDDPPPAAPAPIPPETGPPAPPASRPLAPGAAPVLPLSPPGSAAPSQPPEDHMPNILLQMVVGSALGVGGLYAGAFIGYKADCASGCGGEYGGVGGLLLGAALGLTITTTAGVMLTGTDDDHHSSIGVTWLGTVIGGAVGAVAASKSDSVAGASIVLATSSALGGTLMFYAARSRNRPKSALRVVPFTSGSGLGVALVGNAP